MIRLASTLLAMSIASGAKAEELARTYVLGNEVILLDDGTWRFANENMSVDKLADLEASHCFSLEDGRVELCGVPEGWVRDEIMSDETDETHSFSMAGDKAHLEVSYYAHGGHDGDIEFFTEDVGERSLSERVLEGIFEITAETQVFPDERATVVDDIILFETFSETFGIADYYNVEILSEVESLSVAVTTFRVQDDDPAPPKLATLLEPLMASIMVDGVPLSERVPEGLPE